MTRAAADLRVRPAAEGVRQLGEALDAAEHMHRPMNTGHLEVLDADPSNYCGDFAYRIAAQRGSAIE